MSENKPTQSGDAPDPLATLHRMSTTAGAASQEYVAINLMAVAALVLGLASALVLLTHVLLAIPVAALVCGIFALRQIHNSSGTQTGRAFAILGMLIALGFGAFVGIIEVRDHKTTQREQAEIEKVVNELGQRVMSKDFKGTLSLFTDTLLDRKKLTPDKYAEVWRRATQTEAYGAVTGVSIGRVVLDSREVHGQRGAGSTLTVSFEKSQQPLRREINFRKIGGAWKIDDIPAIFPAPPPDAPPGGPGPGMMPR